MRLSLALAVVCGLATGASAGASDEPRNLARDATASASEVQDDFRADQAVDGDPATRWSGIPGHNSGVWFELDWKAPVTIAEVVLHQFDRYVIELDLQVWDASANQWRTLQHLGAPDRRLPLVAIARFEPVAAAKLRIGNITNGPSFTEVEVYSEPLASGLETRVASDLRGHAIGMVCDAFGSAPIVGAKVELSGRVSSGSQSLAPWSAQCATDADGLFQVSLPFGLRGAVSITTQAGAQRRESTVDAASFSRALAPRDATAPRLALDRGWRFAPDPPAGFEARAFDDRQWGSIDVPAHWELCGFHPSTGVGGYRLHCAAPPGEGRVMLRFDGVYSGASVWVNGSLVAEHEGGFTPFECDVTELMDGADNLLALRATEHTTASDSLDQMSAYADFPLGGLQRRVWLSRVPEVHLEALEFHTEFAAPQGGLLGDAHLLGSFAVLAARARSVRNLRASFRLSDAQGSIELGSVPAFDVPAWQRVERSFAFEVRAPKPWEAEHPNLYQLTVELREGDRLLETSTERVGFRQTRVEGSRLLVNGAPVKIRGTCHHDQDPLRGRAVAPELERRDVELIRAANLNSLRTSHYPPLPELIDAADELGLFVEDEAPFCWVGVSDDLRLAPRILQLTAELLARDRNHPSVFMWSLCNESGFGRDFELSRDFVHRVDASRPLGAATSAWLDLATAHNPISLARIQEYESLKTPMLFDESFAPFQGIWSDAGEAWLDPDVRDDYITPLRAVYDAMMKSRTTQGSQIWAWSDDLFLVPGRGLEYGRGATRVHFVEEAYAMPGRGIVGDAPWGLVDGWRRPKPEYWLVRKLHSPVRVDERPIELPKSGEPLAIAVENQFDFTDLGELAIEWRLGAEHGAPSTKVAIAPHSAGTILVAPRTSAAEGGVLELRFARADGTPVDEFAVPIGRRAAPAPPLEHAGARSLALADESTLAGRATRVIGQDFELAIDRDSGLLRRGVAFGAATLVELPSVHVLVSGRPFDALPDRSTWKARRVEVARAGERVKIEVEGSYEHFDGRYEYLIEPSGECTSTARFRYDGAELFARELGQRVALSRDFDTLDWSRRAEWGVYPDDHIGRPRGTARAFYGHVYERPPIWPWSEDDSPLGSNDFRSTKRQVDWAVLSCASGSALAVFGGDATSVRASVESDRIACFALEFYGGTGARLWEWESNYGRGRNLASGATIESTQRFALGRRASAHDSRR